MALEDSAMRASSTPVPTPGVTPINLSNWWQLFVPRPAPSTAIPPMPNPMQQPTKTDEQQEVEINDQVMQALLQRLENSKTGEYTVPTAGVSRQIVSEGGGPNPAVLIVVLVVVIGGYFLLKKKPKKKGGSTHVEE